MSGAPAAAVWGNSQNICHGGGDDPRFSSVPGATRAVPVRHGALAEVRLVLPGTEPPAPPRGGCRFSPVSVEAAEALLPPFDPDSKVMQCHLGEMV